MDNRDYVFWLNELHKLLKDNQGDSVAAEAVRRKLDDWTDDGWEDSKAIGKYEVEK